jgi:hypothetical protein
VGGASENGQTAIEAFLAGCQPPMSRLLEGFHEARITGEIHLQVMARKSEDDLKKYIMSSGITQKLLEVEALVQAFVQKKSEL